MTRNYCIRCGECCLSSSPTLQKADISLVHDSLIEKRDLYTIRAGELVWDNIRGKLKIIEKETIKIREKEKNKGCIYYDEGGNACTIYENRPIQCRSFACWDKSEFMRTFAGPKTDRRDIIRDRNLLRVIEEHENKCSYAEVGRHVRRIKGQGEKAVMAILELLNFDYKLRQLTSEKLGVDSSEMDLLLGRPLTETITMFGLKVMREPDGSFLLTVL